MNDQPLLLAASRHAESLGQTLEPVVEVLGVDVVGTIGITFAGDLPENTMNQVFPGRPTRNSPSDGEPDSRVFQVFQR